MHAGPRFAVHGQRCFQRQHASGSSHPSWWWHSGRFTWGPGSCQFWFLQATQLDINEYIDYIVYIIWIGSIIQTLIVTGLVCFLNYINIKRKNKFLSYPKMDQHPRLCFPTIQQNSSAVTVLPHFIEVCGRKIDNCDSVLDWVGTGFFHFVVQWCASIHLSNNYHAVN